MSSSFIFKWKEVYPKYNIQLNFFKHITYKVIMKTKTKLGWNEKINQRNCMDFLWMQTNKGAI